MSRLPFKIDKKTIALILSFILNVLGGTGTIEPIVGGVECPPAPVATSAARGGP